ncbi:MAG: uracil-DNA glycosylase family protein [Spirochaetia bacterium]|nr:uracil-DNA glycosylase family protein [Spirochaetia bacterium]
MHVEYYPEILDIVKDLQFTLRSVESHKLLFNRSTEKWPLDIDLSFTPGISEKTVEKFIKQDVCTLCSRRISYKSGQFSRKKIKIPYMVLIHNSFILSEKNYYELPEEDNIFRSMIRGGLKCREEDILTREILRCYFGASDEKNPEFLQNCLKHLREDIDKYKIQGILALGQAASLLLNNDAEKIRQTTGEIIKIEGIPAMICPGPNRIRFMNEKKMDPEIIKKEKMVILEYLNKFRTQVMGIA